MVKRKTTACWSFFQVVKFRSVHFSIGQLKVDKMVFCFVNVRIERFELNRVCHVSLWDQCDYSNTRMLL